MKIAVFCFFPAFDPTSSGGEIRLLNLYKSLSRDISVTMLTSTNFGARHEVIEHTPTFKEVRFPKDQFWRDAYATLDRRGLTGDISGLAMALAVSNPNCPYTRAARAVAANVDVIVHEFPYSEPLFADGVFAAKEIYNSHNFEASLLGAVVDGPGLEAAVLKLLRLEGNLAARAARVIATSSDDADKFRFVYGVPRHRLALCPNGFDGSEAGQLGKWQGDKYSTSSRRPRLLFLASAHPPNVEGATALIAMASSMQECDVVIAGGVCSALEGQPLPRNVALLGPVDMDLKRRLLCESDIAVNPVILGSGTSLKALEALGVGIPLLSTPEGVRGLDLEVGVHAAIVDRRDFPEAVAVLLNEPERTRLMADAGRQFAEARFTWAQSAADLQVELERVVSSQARSSDKVSPVPFILAFNDYPVVSGLSGGEARVLNLLRNLDAEILLVTFGPRFDVFALGPNIMAVLVPKSAEHTAFETETNVGEALSVNDCVASLFVGTNRTMRALATLAAPRANVVVLEHCYMAPILDLVEAVCPGLPVVYSAHNVESLHRVDMLTAHSAGQAISPLVEDLEQSVLARATLVVCCTAVDARRLTRDDIEVLIVPNGCNPYAGALEGVNASSTGSNLQVGFLGSAHGPNIEAANFILDYLAPALPDVEFHFIGSIGQAIETSGAHNVRVHGTVDHATKSLLLSEWAIGLNPVDAGGGSSLKLPDFLAHGLATINTPHGARGFDIVKHGAGLVVDRGEFIQAIKSLLADPTRRRVMAEHALTYAREHLSWSALARPYSAKIHALVARSAANRETVRRSLLVVTYRYTDSTLGGAEEYLEEVLKRMRHRFDQIDLAAVDTGAITNEFHFGCRVQNISSGASSRLAENFDRSFYFSPTELPTDENLARCRRLERDWMLGEFQLSLSFLTILRRQDHPRLLSGFFGLETVKGIERRWTAPEFSMLLPAQAQTVRLTGFGHKTKTLTLKCMRLTPSLSVEIVAESVHVLSPDFVVNFAVPKVPEDVLIIAYFCVDEHEVEGDHRPLGLLLESVSCLTGTQKLGSLCDTREIEVLREAPADFLDNWQKEARTEHFPAWVASLAALAQANKDDTETDFAAVRGPHAPGLQGWLKTHAGAYDSMLVQGIPFDVVPSTVETVSRLPVRPRIIVLPHFHGDDRFYHWRRYVVAFQNADRTLLFSSTLAEALNQNARYSVVPGGGIRPEEMGDVTGVVAFRALHASQTPFFLVLGRKTPSKGYHLAVAAQQALRARGFGVDLVMIGADEDGMCVSGPGIHMLGHQPRTVVLGALRGCVGLLSMSDSESFGIVICEAWMFGRPVIANRTCYASRELVQHGHTGLLVGDRDELADAMQVVLTDTDFGEAMGRRGRDQLLSRFTWDCVADQVYEACVDPRSMRQSE